MRWWRVVGSGIVAISCILNGLQGRYILQLHRELDACDAKGQLRPGILMDRLAVKDIHGERVVIDFANDNKPTILYVFRPSCIWCQRNREALKSLVRQVSRSHRVIGLSLVTEGTPEFVREHGLDFPVYTDLPASSIALYRLGATPETILINEHGEVVQSWNGAYTGITKSAIEEVLSITLRTAATE